MSTSPGIRAASSADLPAITAIYAEHVLRGTASFELDPPDLSEMRQRFAALAAQRYPYIVAERAGEVIGYAYAGPFRARPAYRFTVEDSIYIRSESHRQGIGRLLLRSLLDASAACGARQMIAIIGDSANVPSIALHRACGFVDAGLLVASGFKFGRWVDTVIMQRPLGAGAMTLPG